MSQHDEQHDNDDTFEDDEDMASGASESDAPGADSQKGGEQRKEREERRRFDSAKELLTDELRRRASNANPKLRAQLLGSVLVQMRGTNERYLFDWTTEDLRVEQVQSGTADCSIKISEDNLLKIASGDLNPQIGMLSDKIQIEGQLALAVYFFNLIAPRVS